MSATPTYASRTTSREWPPEVQAVMDGIARRLTWASMHWDTERVSPDAWPHIAAAALDAAPKAALNTEALEDLVRHAMASGAGYFIDKATQGQVDRSAPLMDAFGDFPAQFLSIRSGLVERLADGGAS